MELSEPITHLNKTEMLKSLTIISQKCYFKAINKATETTCFADESLEDANERSSRTGQKLKQMQSPTYLCELARYAQLFAGRFLVLKFGSNDTEPSQGIEFRPKS